MNFIRLLPEICYKKFMSPSMQTWPYAVTTNPILKITYTYSWSYSITAFFSFLFMFFVRLCDFGRRWKFIFRHGNKAAQSTVCERATTSTCMYETLLVYIIVGGLTGLLGTVARSFYLPKYEVQANKSGLKCFKCNGKSIRNLFKIVAVNLYSVCVILLLICHMVISIIIIK